MRTLDGVVATALVVSFVAGAAGCHSSASGTPADGAAGASGAAGSIGDAGLPALDADVSTAEGFCQAFFQIAGGFFAQCFGLPQTYSQKLFSDPIFCERFTASIAAGRTRFTPAHAAACLAELPMDFLCNSSPAAMAMPSACNEAVTPLVPPGGACRDFAGTNLAAECMGDAYCRQGPGHCDGTCTVRAAIGQPCDSSTQLLCVKSATCDSATKRCVAAIPDATEGQACTTGAQPGCAKGLFCELSASDGGSTGVCRAQKTSGPCASDVACANLYRCAGPSGAGACAAPKAAGASCTPGLRECSLFGYCGAGHVCIEMDAAIGQACGLMNGENVPCAEGAYCDGPLFAAGTCRALEQAGDACDPKVLLQCGGNYGECDATTKLCVACPL